MLSISQFWYLLPLIASVSLVYGATRHELPDQILLQAYKSAVWMLSFMSIIFGVLFLFDWWVQ
jgi:hypothetical protein